MENAAAAEVNFESSRQFQVWTYRVGHQQLLLRSVKTESNPTRIDILFVGVSRMALPTTLNELRVSGKGPYRLSGRDWNGEVDAVNCAIAEDDGEYFDESPFHEGSGI